MGGRFATIQVGTLHRLTYHLEHVLWNEASPCTPASTLSPAQTAVIFVNGISCTPHVPLGGADNEVRLTATIDMSRDLQGYVVDWRAATSRMLVRKHASWEVLRTSHVSFCGFTGSQQHVLPSHTETTHFSLAFCTRPVDTDA